MEQTASALTKVLIVDDHPASREGLMAAIMRQPDLESCGEASNPSEAMRLIESCRPDVVVVDVRLGNASGIDLIKRILARDESIRILAWSMHAESLYAERALRAGALGYITKENSTRQIVDAIRRVRDGEIYLSPEAGTRMLRLAVGRGQGLRDSPLESLSDRELDVFRAIGEGLSSAQTARRLHLSVHTVETHRQRIKEKLNLKTANELTRAATQWVLEGGG